MKAPVVAEPMGRPQAQTRAPARAAAAPVKRERKKGVTRAAKTAPAALAAPEAPAALDDVAPVDPQIETGGVRAPDAPVVEVPAAAETVVPDTGAAPAPITEPSPEAAPAADAPPAAGEGGTAAPQSEAAPPVG